MRWAGTERIGVGALKEGERRKLERVPRGLREDKMRRGEKER